jgi:hypothetical protein
MGAGSGQARALLRGMVIFSFVKWVRRQLPVPPTVCPTSITLVQSRRGCSLTISAVCGVASTLSTLKLSRIERMLNAAPEGAW